MGVRVLEEPATHDACPTARRALVPSRAHGCRRLALAANDGSRSRTAVPRSSRRGSRARQLDRLLKASERAALPRAAMELDRPIPIIPISCDRLPRRVRRATRLVQPQALAHPGASQPQRCTAARLLVQRSFIFRSTDRRGPVRITPDPTGHILSTSPGRLYVLVGDSERPFRFSIRDRLRFLRPRRLPRRTVSSHAVDDFVERRCPLDREVAEPCCTAVVFPALGGTV